MLHSPANVHIRAFLYELAYTCKSPAYGNGTAVPMLRHKQRAAYTDMPNKQPFAEATTRVRNGAYTPRVYTNQHGTCNSPAYGDAPAVLLRWCNRHAAYTDMPNMYPCVEATTSPCVEATTSPCVEATTSPCVEATTRGIEG